jgi:RNA polymerase sigma factor (sigma-70 family)
MMKERSDPEWVRSVKSSDPQVLDELWTKVFTWSVMVANRYRQDEHCAQDVAEEAFARIQRGVAGFAFRCPFLGWCRTIVIHEMKRWLTKQQRYIELNQDLDETDNIPHSAAHVMLPESTMQVGDEILRARLQPCLDNLNVQERDVIKLRYEQELLPQAVADNLSLTRNFVNVIAHRARQKLLDCLQKRGYTGLEDILSL